MKTIDHISRRYMLFARCFSICIHCKQLGLLTAYKNIYLCNVERNSFFKISNDIIYIHIYSGNYQVFAPQHSRLALFDCVLWFYWFSSSRLHAHFVIQIYTTLSIAGGTAATNFLASWDFNLCEKINHRCASAGRWWLSIINLNCFGYIHCRE